MESILSTRIRALREEKGLSQEQISGFLGLDVETYLGYESGQCKQIPISIMEDLANLYGTNLLSLIEQGTEPDCGLLPAINSSADVCIEDLRQIATFHAVALNYQKMNRLMNYKFGSDTRYIRLTND